MYKRVTFDEKSQSYVTLETDTATGERKASLADEAASDIIKKIARQMEERERLSIDALRFLRAHRDDDLPEMKRMNKEYLLKLDGIIQEKARNEERQWKDAGEQWKHCADIMGDPLSALLFGVLRLYSEKKEKEARITYIKESEYIPIEQEAGGSDACKRMADYLEALSATGEGTAKVIVTQGGDGGERLDIVKTKEEAKGLAEDQSFCEGIESRDKLVIVYSVEEKRLEGLEERLRNSAEPSKVLREELGEPMAFKAFGEGKNTDGMDFDIQMGQAEEKAKDTGVSTAKQEQAEGRQEAEKQEKDITEAPKDNEKEITLNIGEKEIETLANGGSAKATSADGATEAVVSLNDPTKPVTGDNMVVREFTKIEGGATDRSMVVENAEGKVSHQEYIMRDGKLAKRTISEDMIADKVHNHTLTTDEKRELINGNTIKLDDIVVKDKKGRDVPAVSTVRLDTAANELKVSTKKSVGKSKEIEKKEKRKSAEKGANIQKGMEISF